MGLNIIYKDNQIAELHENGNILLKTAKKYTEDDIKLVYKNENNYLLYMENVTYENQLVYFGKFTNPLQNGGIFEIILPPLNSFTATDYPNIICIATNFSETQRWGSNNILIYGGINFSTFHFQIASVGFDITINLATDNMLTISKNGIFVNGNFVYAIPNNILTSTYLFLAQNEGSKRYSGLYKKISLSKGGI